MEVYLDYLIIDSTYKTNRYDMPLVYLSGRTPLGKSFTVAYSFVSREKQGDYQFILEQYKNQFNLL
jgi:hypothetical protein